jgi:hypothetical protein
MIDSQLEHLRLGACTRRIAAAATSTKAPALAPVASTTLLGASPPRRHTSQESII